MDPVAEHVRQQSFWCGELGSPLYADLLARAADDVEAGGPVADALAGRSAEPGSALALRLVGTVHRMVLEREAPRLAVHYPSVGGRPGPPDQVWAAFRDVVTDRLDDVRAGLASPPQTNEVGRSAALLAGLHLLVTRARLPVRLVELGASAGLNLRPDLVRVEVRVEARTAAEPAWVGPSDSPVVLPDAWRGHVPVGDLRVVDRLGTDIAPVDPSTTEGRLRLTSYVWPDMLDRLERLRGAFALVPRAPARLLPAGAADTVEGLRPVEGTWTVVWHSVVRQYLPEEERGRLDAALDALGAAATPAAPVAHLAMEFAEEDCPLRLRTWPAGDDEVVARVAAHGLPVTWA